MSRDRRLLGVWRLGKVPATESEIRIPFCLYLAGTSVSTRLKGDPMRKTLEKAA